MQKVWGSGLEPWADYGICAFSCKYHLCLPGLEAVHLGLRGPGGYIGENNGKEKKMETTVLYWFTYIYIGIALRGCGYEHNQK